MLCEFSETATQPGETINIHYIEEEPEEDTTKLDGAAAPTYRELQRDQSTEGKYHSLYYEIQPWFSHETQSLGQRFNCYISGDVQYLAVSGQCLECHAMLGIDSKDCPTCQGEVTYFNSAGEPIPAEHLQIPDLQGVLWDTHQHRK